ncbi:acetyltransferase (GNAT) family protein [Vibrio sinaloensis DSM 21326]|uniref:Acetyltransferase (GNAT) family protein n=1 Tax=Vibrio sinaloensis DSM 21326 TaxID=945550 RepID=E8M573_PHOS4|nr:hypothetical protein [Vibrio sinaloensis]EGA70924.1 acetyltransferase (GNAT) family protein [Vibrio sinaloensis DSM 21326]
MKVIDATWEKRNLGLSTAELMFESADTIDTYDKWYQSVMDHVEYIVAKVPVGDMSLCNDLLGNGFELRELLTEVSVNQLPTLSRIQQRMVDHVTYREMTSTDYRSLEKHICSGMFNTDRIALDSSLGLEKSIQRYLGWLGDEKERGAKFYTILYKGEPAGFFVLSAIQGNKVKSILAGIYPSHQRYALGFFMNYMAYLEAFKQGVKSVVTYFSSNNRGASSIHYSIACQLHTQYYVLSKRI